MTAQNTQVVPSTISRVRKPGRRNVSTESPAAVDLLASDVLIQTIDSIPRYFDVGFAMAMHLVRELLPYKTEWCMTALAPP